MRELPFELLNRFPFARWAPISLRLIVGYGFMQHGFAKLARGPDAFATILHALGVPVPHFMAWATIVTEVLGGLAVILGAFVTLVSLPMADRWPHRKAEQSWTFIIQARSLQRRPEAVGQCCSGILTGT